ncbi:hypothetical protein ACLHDF_27430 [Priestia aryabhattai]|uniref:hypothetical protein n=1 Tax=Priestia megaterium TaxID=1404 RepID=UPI0039B87075
MSLQGEVKIRILIDSGDLLKEFESAYRSLVKMYIESTTIAVRILRFEKGDNHLIILFECNDIPLSYFYPLNEQDNEIRKSKEYELKIAQSLFEFWSHWLIKTFFIEELSLLNPRVY